jgi:hypothetical protein
MIGQQELRHRVARIPQLNPWVAVRAHLGPLPTEKMTSYITARMGFTTDWTDVLIKEALSVIYQRSKRMGLVINILGDQSFFAGAIEPGLQIDDPLVQRVGEVI